jgi:signal transduction histidine kinase
MKPPSSARLLIVDDEAAQMRALCDTLDQEGYATRGFTSGLEAVAALREQPFDLLLTDLMMPQIDGIALMRACHAVDRDLACIVMTGNGTIASAVDALKAGALDYVLKPFRVNSIVSAVTRALTVRRLQLENIQLRESVSIYELARAITQDLEPEEIIAKTVVAAGHQSDAGAVYVLVAGPDGRSLRVAGSSGPGAQPLQSDWPAVDEALARWIGQARTALEAQNVEHDAHALFAHPFGPSIGVALPIAAGEKFFGVLGFSSARVEGRVNTGQIKALDVLARTAATALATAALLTELRGMNEALEQRVQERTRELEAANKDLESFSYSVAHDLREPLRVIEGFSDAFRDEFSAGVPEQGRELLNRIWAGASRMTQLINDLLHFSRFSREPMHCVRVPLRELVLQVATRLEERLGDRKVSVQVGELPDCFGDRALLEQVLVNLMSNAFKFTSGRALARVDVGSLRQGEDLAYYVRDNGVGFDMRYADKLFGVFQRLHTREAFEGTGIGLSIVHRIIARHGGRVWADSRPGEGTTLYFSLPAKAEQSSL